jgi:hypothetical protein
MPECSNSHRVDRRGGRVTPCGYYAEKDTRGAGGRFAAGLEGSQPARHLGVTLMAVLGSSSVSPAFPKVVAELGISPGQVGLLITVFTLPGVFLTPVSGVLSDKFGRKTVLIPSLLLFGVAGGACALARDFELLLGLRVLQGVGAAALGATNVTLIGDLFAGRERTAALGYNSSVLSAGTALPGDRRLPGDVRLVLSVRAPPSRHPHRLPGRVLAAQPRATQRAGPEGIRA